MTVQEYYLAAGGDYDRAIATYGSDKKLQRYLGIFLRSTDIDQLGTALADQDTKAVFMVAHSLKGTASNMCLDTLAEAAASLTEATRAGEWNDDIVALAEAVQAAHAACVDESFLL